MTPRDAEGLSVKLLPCPFCGDAPLVKVRPADKFETGNTGKVWSITCYGSVTNAHAWFYADTKEKVVAAWNRRTQAPAPVGEGVGEGLGSLQSPPAEPTSRPVCDSELSPPTARDLEGRTPDAETVIASELNFQYGVYPRIAQEWARGILSSLRESGFTVSPPASSDLEGGE